MQQITHSRWVQKTDPADEFQVAVENAETEYSMEVRMEEVRHREHLERLAMNHAEAYRQIILKYKVNVPF